MFLFGRVRGRAASARCCKLLCRRGQCQLHFGGKSFINIPDCRELACADAGKWDTQSPFFFNSVGRRLKNSPVFRSGANCDAFNSIRARGKFGFYLCLLRFCFMSLSVTVTSNLAGGKLSRYSRCTSALIALCREGLYNDLFWCNSTYRWIHRQ